MEIITRSANNRENSEHAGRSVHAAFGRSDQSDHSRIGNDLNEILMINKTSTYVLKVSCNSMEDAGIVNGDLVVVDRNAKPVNGRIVIAVVDGEMVIRRYERTMNKLFLTQACNRLGKMEIGDFSDCSIWGVVVYIIREI